MGIEPPIDPRAYCLREGRCRVAVYADGLESERMPEALEATSSLLGAVGATLEVISKPAQLVFGPPAARREPYPIHRAF
jgi:hypothetical protein